MRVLLLLTLAFLGASLAVLADAPSVVEAPGAYPTLVNPNCSHCKDEAQRRKEELRDDDRVLCWTRGKYDGGAIPFRFFLHKYRVISDTYGVFVHDHEAGFARAFEPSLEFSFHGWRNGVMVIKHKDGTLFSALSGVAFAGKRKGERLKPVATLTSKWGPWLKQYPDTVAFHLYAKYKAEDAPKMADDRSIRSRGKIDSRLKPDDRVLGVYAGNAAKAYPLKALSQAGVIADTIGKESAILLYHEGTAAAYGPVALLKVKGGGVQARIGVKLEVAPKNSPGPFVEKQTKSYWDIAGRCVAGPDQGHELAWLDGVEVNWFAWAADYPETTIHGK